MPQIIHRTFIKNFIYNSINTLNIGPKIVKTTQYIEWIECCGLPRWCTIYNLWAKFGNENHINIYIELFYARFYVNVYFHYIYIFRRYVLYFRLFDFLFCLIVSCIFFIYYSSKRANKVETIQLTAVNVNVCNSNAQSNLIFKTDFRIIQMWTVYFSINSLCIYYRFCFYFLTSVLYCAQLFGQSLRWTIRIVHELSF